MPISAISDQSNNLYQLLQAFQSSSTTAQPGVSIASTPKVASTDSDGDSDGSGPSRATSAATAPTSSTGTNPQAGTLLQQLQTSIQNALSNLDPSAANNPSDVYKAVSQAIDSTLKANGVDTSKAHGHGHHHHHGGDAESGSGTPTTGTSTAGIVAGASTAGSTSTTSQASNGNGGLDALLSQLNVDPQQFKADLFAAIAGAQTSPTGTVGLDQVFQNFPTGQNVNALA